MLDLTLDAVRDLAEDVAGNEGRDETPFGTYVFTPSDPGVALALHVERSVFEESFGSTADDMREEFAPYAAASLFFCVVDHCRRLPVGAVRIIVPNPVGLKSLDDIEVVWGQSVHEVLARNALALDETRTWDIATLAVAPGYRNRVVSQALHQAIGVGTMNCGIDWYASVLDIRALRLLQAQLSRVFRLYEGVEPAMYAGSESVPVWSDLVEYRERLRSAEPALYETIFGGRNLEAVVSLFDGEQVAAVARDLVRAERAGAERAGTEPQAMSGRAA
ncbi:MAG: hypothetical protein GEV08_09850 [Acidimicrobiia bacterium]|nr:hypothetical protein [Acidimicrobiia bacterium]